MNGAPIPCFGRARIQPLASGNYRPSDDGQLAIVLGVYDRFNELVDTVSWFLGDPSRWWLRFGDECPVLGCRDLATAAYFGDPVRLYSTPQIWLFAHARPPRGSVVCVIDWGVDLGPLFEGVSCVGCDSPDLQKRLRRSLREWEPRITAPRERTRRAP